MSLELDFEPYGSMPASLKENTTELAESHIAAGKNKISDMEDKQHIASTENNSALSSSVISSQTSSSAFAEQAYIGLLLETRREGIENVVEQLRNTGFFNAPASTVFHGNYAGGLTDHSLNVCKVALELRDLMVGLQPELAPALPRESVILSALLHDVCKADVYKEEEKWRKDANNRWESYKTYGVDYSAFPVGHGEKSVIRLLQWGLRLDDNEILAIRWHMSAWDLPFQSSEFKGNFSAAQNKCKLLSLIQAADGLATSMLDKKKN